MFVLTQLQAVATCTLLVTAFVGLFYAVPARVRDLHRDNPVQVRYRFGTITAVCCAAPVALRLLWWVEDGAAPGFWAWLGFRARGFGYACALPLALTAMLFTGSLAVAYLERRSMKRRFGPKAPWLGYVFPNSSADAPLLAARNLVVGPFSEEFVFRSCMVPLVFCSGAGRLAAIAATPLVFGLAHLHHAIGMVRSGQVSARTAALRVLFQLGYTTVFGAYEAFVFLRTGHFVAIFLLHSFCNLMGLPSVGFWFRHHPLFKYRIELTVAYVTGMALFAICIVPLTTPSIYGNEAMWNFVPQQRS